MGIRLLKKDEIAKAQSIDRSREIAEGLKISRKVDALRELQADEELKLSKFRSKILEEIQKEIDVLTKKKEAIEDEIIKLSSKRDSILPDIERKAKNLEKLEARLDEKEKKIDIKKELADQIKKEATSLLKKAETADSQAQGRRMLAEELHKKAQSDRDEATSLLAYSREIEMKTLENAKRIEDSFTGREETIQRKEKVCSERERSILEQEKEIAEEKIRLQDQRGTLERAFNRL